MLRKGYTPQTAVRHDSKGYITITTYRIHLLTKTQLSW